LVSRSLNQSIFRLVVGIMMPTTILILVSVWATTTEHAKNQSNSLLQVAQKVFEQVLFNRESLLYNSAGVLTADFGFKQAVATGDKATIDSALLNHGERIQADLMALISLDGTTISSIPLALKVGEPFPFPDIGKKVVATGGVSSLQLINERLYQIILLTIDAPTPIAIALVGFEINNELVHQLQSVTQLETTIRVQGEDEDSLRISTLAKNDVDKALSQQDQPLSWLSLTVLNDMPYVSRQFLLADEGTSKVWITLSYRVQSLFAQFSALQIQITLIALLAIVLALGLAALFSRKVARPLVALADVAQHISKGNYEKKIINKSSLKEVANLAKSLQSMQTNIDQREKKIRYQAQHDILTGLNNRYNIEVLLEEKFTQDYPFLAIGVNILGFRGINDVFGYHNGDLCLQILANRIKKMYGLAARLAGGELLWVPDKLVSPQQLAQFKEMLEQPIDTGEATITAKVAVGVLRCGDDAANTGELFRRMNIVLDEAKVRDQPILNYDPEFEQLYLRRLSIIAELKTALTDQPEELSLHYQPKLNLHTGEVSQVEGLLRWHNGVLGFVSPEDFITIAEQVGFIGKITDWVINQAIEDAVKLRDAGLNISIAINLSAQDVLDKALLPHILSLMAAQGLDSSALSFEMTESDLVVDPHKAIAQLQAFREQGFALAIDDFGTGYSSMSYLKNLPVTTLKVDKSFIMQLDSQEGDQKIVKTVIDLAHNFGLDVVAEGIENHATLMLLRDWGCDLAQGYYMSRPLPFDKFLVWQLQHQNTNWWEI
jgi:diguanylate cyclase (GGDEF)-like protein